MIKWDKRFSVNNEVIDAEHKLLLLTINSIEMCLRHPQEKDILLFFLTQLVTFAEEHFEREEHLQLISNFPHLEENKRGHVILLSGLNFVKEDMMKIVSKEELTELDIHTLNEHLTYLAKDWLLEHIFKEDLKMKTFEITTKDYTC